MEMPYNTQITADGQIYDLSLKVSKAVKGTTEVYPELLAIEGILKHEGNNSFSIPIEALMACDEWDCFIPYQFDNPKLSYLTEKEIGFIFDRVVECVANFLAIIAIMQIHHIGEIIQLGKKFVSDEKLAAKELIDVAFIRAINATVGKYLKSNGNNEFTDLELAALNNPVPTHCSEALFPNGKLGEKVYIRGTLNFRKINKSDKEMINEDDKA